MSFVEAKKLVHKFNRRDASGEVCEEIKALDEVDLTVESGTFVAILGHNGSGKSTFAKHLNALLEPTSGSLYIDGRDAADIKNLYAIREMAGMVFQNPDNQIVASVVEEDVAFGPENIGIPTEEIQKRVTDALERVDMSAYRYHSPNRLSGGQKQRIAIAGVVAMQPRCIIFDESTAMLDPDGRKEVLKTARDLNKNQGVTIIWITHYMEEVTEADKVFVMHSGKVKLEGTPREIFSQVEKILSYGLDVPQVTKLGYDLKKRGLDIPDGILNRKELVNALCQLK